MPSVYSVSKAVPLLSSTVITPSLPTLSITSAIRSPISLSGAELLVDRHIAAARAERGLDRIGHLIDAALERAPGLLVEQNLLWHILENPPLITVSSHPKSTRSAVIRTVSLLPA